MMGSKAVAESPQETPLAGIDTYIDALLDEGIRVVLLRDNPRFDTDMFACVERYGPDSSRCMRDVDDMLARLNPAAGSERDGVMLADLTDYLCPAGLCRAVIGGVVVYLDDNHITKTYGLTMSPALALELRDLFLELGYDRDLLGADAGQVGPHLPTD